MNQAYDQEQAKKEKAGTKALLEMACLGLPGNVNQWQLVAILCVWIRGLDGAVWTCWFISVNLHPKFCLLFVDWLLKNWSSGKHYIPTDKSLKGRRVTELMMSLDGAAVDELIDVCLYLLFELLIIIRD